MLRSNRVVARTVILLASTASCAMAQDHPNKPSLVAGDKVTITGCLQGSENGIDVIDGNETFVSFLNLTGAQIEMVQQLEQEHVRAEGIVTKVEQEGFYDATLTSLVPLPPPPAPELSAESKSPAKWKHKVNAEFGISFAHPDSAKPIPHDSDDSDPHFDFPLETGSVSIARYTLPETLFAGTTNFTGGSLAIAVNHDIHNAGSCQRFSTVESDADGAKLSAETIAGLQYALQTASDAGSGHEGYYATYHTFQNGLCYEFAFYLGYNYRSGDDILCTIPKVGDSDLDGLAEAILTQTVFSLPEQPLTPAPVGKPNVEVFTVSDTVVNDSNNRPSAFSLTWKTTGIDFVELHFTCPTAEAALDESTDGGFSMCKPNGEQGAFYHHGPNEGIPIFFIDDNLCANEDPIPVTVTLMPYIQGEPYPTAAKTLEVTMQRSRASAPCRHK